MPTFVNFGPDQPPHADPSSPVRGPTAAQPDALEVEETLEAVARSLAMMDGAWPSFTQVRGEQKWRVYVNPRAVRFITECG
jgi:hypothetical protein